MWIPEPGVPSEANGAMCPICGAHVKPAQTGDMLISCVPDHTCANCGWTGFAPDINQPSNDSNANANQIEEQMKEEVIALVDPVLSRVLGLFYFNSAGWISFCAYRLPEMPLWDCFEDELQLDELIADYDMTRLERWVMDCDEAHALEIIELNQTFFGNPAIETMSDDWVVDREKLATHGHLDEETSSLVPSWFSTSTHFENWS